MWLPASYVNVSHVCHIGAMGGGRRTSRSLAECILDRLGKLGRIRLQQPRGVGAARGLSMPSRALTRPFALAPVSDPRGSSSATDASNAFWISRTSAGVFQGARAGDLRKQAQRAHTLSPLVPAEALLRTALQRTGAPSQGGSAAAAAVAALAEQTLSAAAQGGAAVWVVRGGEVLAGTASTDEQPAARKAGADALSVALRLGDVVALAAAGADWKREALLAAAGSGGLTTPEAVWLRCVDAETSEAWAPLSDAAPHPSWSQTIFNEYGTHDSS